MLHVVFRVGNADYVLPALAVVQMESFGGATHVPGTPPHVAGVVQLRGRVVPVVDLRARFGLAPAERGLDARVIVVRVGERHVALLADRAREVIEVPDDAFGPTPEIIAEQAAGFVRSVAQKGDRILMLVDLERIVGRDSLPQEEHRAEAT